MAENLFITGFLRSGTTLLEKLLHNHPDICIGPQPFPYLFYRAKDIFYAKKKITDREYPLGHLFLERGYSPEEFNEFLAGYYFSEKEVVGAFDEMKNYSGCLMPELRDYRDQLGGGNFLEVYIRLTELVARIFNKREAIYKGSKEAFCEEYIPFFLGRKLKVILIIRDPRDMFSSISSGKGKDYAREGLPLLHILRSWRKSVAFALAFKDNPDFLFLRYEDLVKDTWKALDAIAGFLNVAPFQKDYFKNGILDQRGKLWKSNSSFEPRDVINTGSVGKFRETLSKDTINFIEKICLPEMLALGYEPAGNPADIDEQNLMEEETRRLNLLSSEITEKEKREWFIFPQAYDTLSRTVSHAGR